VQHLIPNGGCGFEIHGNNDRDCRTWWHYEPDADLACSPRAVRLFSSTVPLGRLLSSPRSGGPRPPGRRAYREELDYSGKRQAAIGPRNLCAVARLHHLGFCHAGSGNVQRNHGCSSPQGHRRQVLENMRSVPRKNDTHGAAEHQSQHGKSLDDAAAPLAQVAGRLAPGRFQSN